MKLHLPKGLRAALLAVMTTAAAFTTTVQAATYDKNACSYENLKYFKDDTWASYQEGTVTELENNKPSDGLQLTYMPDANLQDWVLTIDAYNMTPVISGDNEALGFNIFGTTGATVDNDTGVFTLNGANSIAIFVSATGEIRLGTTSENAESLRNDVILGYLDRDWTKDIYDAAVSIRLILAWDADGGQPHAVTNGRYGSLTLVGIKLLSNENDHAILEDIDSHYVGQKVITNYDLPENLFGWPINNYPSYAIAGSGQVKYTLRSTGEGREDAWVPNGTWMVTGRTSINKLMEGGYYYDEVNNKYRELGGYSVQHPLVSDVTESVTDTIHFSGKHGALVLEEKMAQTAGIVNPSYEIYSKPLSEDEYQLGNYREISFEIDPYSATPEAVAGFGAEKDLTLRVDIDVMENTALNAEACGLSVVGEGTTILEIDNTGYERINGDLKEDSAFAGDGNALKAHLESKGYKTTGLRFENVYKDGFGTELFSFAIKDTDAECYLTFADTDANSKIILSPKGNGVVHLNLHTSNIDTTTSITMVDESPVQTEETRVVPVPNSVPKLAWFKVNDVPEGTPVFDDLGNPRYADANGNEVSTATVGAEGDPQPKVIYARRYDPNTNLPIVGEDGLPEYQDWPEGTPEEDKIYQVKNAQGIVVYTIKLEHVPEYTNEIIAKMDKGQVVMNNGIAQTVTVTHDEERVVQVWRSKNEHTAIEKTVAGTYTPVVSAPDHQVANSIAGTQMTINLYSSAIDASDSQGGFFENSIASGTIYIDGRKAIMGKDKIGADVQVDGIFSRLTTTGLKSAGSIIVDSYLVVKGDIESKYSVDINSGVTIAENVTSQGGTVSVGKAALINDPNDSHGAALIVTDTLTVKNNENNGAIFSPRLKVDGGASINKLLTDNLVYVGTDEDDYDVLPDAWLSVGEAEAPEIRTPWISIHGESTGGTTYTAQKLLGGWTYFYNDNTPTIKDTDFFTINGVKCTNSGLKVMSSEKIEGNTTIELRSEKTILIAQEMLGSDIYLGDTRSDADITPIITNLSHEQIDDNSDILVTHSQTEATGRLSADSIVMPEGYNLYATELQVGSLVVSTGSEEEVATFATGRSGSPTGTSYDNVTMTEATVNASITQAKSITADNIVLGTGHILTAVGDTLEIDADTIVAGDNTVLNNVKMLNGELTTHQGVYINNLQMDGGTFKTLGSATITNMNLANVKTFGGENGDAFTPVASNDGKAAMTFNANISDDGNSMTLTAINFNASGHDFTKEGSISVIEASEGHSISVDPNATVVYKVGAFVDAQIDAEALKNGQLNLVGQNVEGKVVKDLIAGKDARADIMKDVQGIVKSEHYKGGVLGNLYNEMGMIMETPTSHRQQILDAIGGASITALGDSQRRGVQNVQNSLRNRIIQMGGNADWENAGIQAWAQADGSFSTTKSSDEAEGYDYNAWGATVGANIDLAETVTAGMSLSASYGEITSDSADKATGDSNAYYVNLFARHQTGRWTQMLILTAGQNDLTLERTVGSYTAEGDTTGSTFSAYYEVGYTLGLNDEFTHIIQPIVSARITSAKVDGYTETGSIGDAALSYDGSSYTYGTIGVGFRYQGVMYESVFERNSVLEVRAMVTSDFGDATNTAKVALGQGKAREIEGVDTTGTGFDFGVGLSIPMEMQTTLFFDADVNIRPDYTGVSANIGLRYDF